MSYEEQEYINGLARERRERACRRQWMKQVAAICLTAFLQTTILYLGLLTFPDNMLLGMGILLSANEVPRIAQQFGLDSSVKVNMMSVVHATTTAVNLTRTVARSVK